MKPNNPTPLPQASTGIRTACIVGSSSGLGAAFAHALAARGHHLLLVARREQRLHTLAETLQAKHEINVETLRADLATDAGVAAVVETLDRLPPCEYFIYSAGFGTRKKFAELHPTLPARMVQVHNLAPVKLVRSALPKMIQNGRGAIILVSSLGAFFTTSRYTTYSATKAFLNTFCRGLHAELKDTGIAVQALCPGLTRTEFFTAPDFDGFSYPLVPASMWMEPATVVADSLAALGKGNPVHVAGIQNRLFVSLMQAPMLGRLFDFAINRITAGRDDVW
jgi:hypothetical protein